MNNATTVLTRTVVLRVLTMLWGEDTDITPEFGADAELLRIERGLK